MPKDNGLVDPRLGSRILASTRLRRDELRVERAIKKALAVHKAKAITALKRQHLTAAAPVDPFALVSWDTSVDDDVLPLIGTVLTDLADSTMRFLQLPPEVRSQLLGQIDIQAGTQNFVDKVRTIGPDVAGRLSDQLQIGVAQGESIPKLTDRINDVFDIGDNVAERIARTETHGAAEATKYSSVGAISKAGFSVTKSYVATDDDRTRESHLQAEEDNQDVPFDAPFIVAGLETDVPGNTGDPSEDINCRCAAVYSQADDSDDIDAPDD